MMSEISNIELEKDEENLLEFSHESEVGYTSDFMIHQDQLVKVSKTKLYLDKSKVFNKPNALLQFAKTTFRRKNEIFYCVSSKEIAIDICDVSGQVYLPLLTRKEVGERLGKINPEIRKKISTVHIGAVKILLKAQFKDGIDTPIKMALIDNRINSRRDCILGAAKGNLAYGKFMFTVYPKFGLSLTTANLDQVLSFIHEFERKDLMNKGDKVFSITYLIGYALTNSHHSIDYCNNPNIELEDVFQEIGQVEESQFCRFAEADNSWAINIAKNKKLLGDKPKASIRGTSLTVGEPSERNLLKSVSMRIDYLSKRLESFS